MNKEKLKSLSKYLSSLIVRLNDEAVPHKHQNRKETYREFLMKEIALVKSTIEKGKL